ncbi:MAG: hypothetical protein E6J34_04500 [Chloroflexi bacterium]|nr:MAG: hypothetical protein E6J34_04500 [Chloroflexota bacterium]
MKSRLWNRCKAGPVFSLYLKCGAVFSLLLMSILVVACGDTTTTTSPLSSSGPAPTVTIQMNSNTSVPTLPDFWCGAWAPQTTPAFNQHGNTLVTINAKFVQNTNGNPQGVGDATATATIWWSPNVSETQQATTTGDGLAVFFFSAKGKDMAVNHNSIVTVQFTKPGVKTCTVDQERAAFFTLIPATSPSATPCAHKKHNNGQCKNGG